jgi:hypothetical protein
MALEFDAQMRSRVLVLDGREPTPLGDFESSETLTVADSRAIRPSARRSSRRAAQRRGAWTGRAAALRGVADGGIEKTVSVTF